ncbi:MAG: hypothetical protein KIT09_02300 [Bryobacteraceae bacterium]|nr:hypothetical protein [Bryobacteraceae bacterium]
MEVSELKTNAIVRGPVLPEPVQVIRVAPMGVSIKLVGMPSIAPVEPLPRQLWPVYDHFLRLPRIRFLLAGAPGAGRRSA